MERFEFIPFEYKNSWQECLSLYLFIEIILNGKPLVGIDFSTYSDIEFWESQIEAYRDWLEKKEDSKGFIEDYWTENKELLKHFSDEFGVGYLPKVIYWNDRIKNSYFKRQLQEAFLFENFIAEKIKTEYGLDIEPFFSSQGQYELGENALGIEIKNDKLIKETGNIYIEFQEKSGEHLSNYTNSGILKQDNTRYFLMGDYSEFFILRKSDLLEVYREELNLIAKGIASVRGVEFKQISTSKGFILPVGSNRDLFVSFDEMMNELMKENGNERL
ncbi:MAG: hypothetical protein GX159_06235 [Flavobacteriaceae bacterium]|jgi:hypothetical protein|nr:hypothetical protein [Flavobacteriaceae bacterium]